MFTGIIEYLAEIEDIKKNKIGKSKKTESKGNHYIEITVNLAKSTGVKIGDSISINGACLTVTKLNNTIATFQVIDETINKTNFKDLKKGDKVNIERSLKIGARLEGHFVLGHIDGIGIIKKIEINNKGSRIIIDIANRDILHLIAQKGSIAIDGISLTIANIKKNMVEIAIIPHTLENTTIGIKKAGDAVNIEVDILSRYIANIYQFSSNNKENSKVY